MSLCGLVSADSDTLQIANAAPRPCSLSVPAVLLVKRKQALNPETNV